VQVQKRHDPLEHPVPNLYKVLHMFAQLLPEHSLVFEVLRLKQNESPPEGSWTPGEQGRPQLLPTQTLEETNMKNDGEITEEEL
jgi:hypothetical protein